ncbi:hypothetical protein [Simiduia agarivorans]|uniref:Uncharacterized protein n=1 Tax=Simiduia agarivorans (strain DSM 21679 / JCM 13881 / BCRC 17597 / SA1) TaxID=1117647 RepID=K4KWY2_SIMAS|nr:hypothetical protein [Simiduia agarivorans]AFU98452.2 hypothetical protein M5M_06285 [Simiduia agarivorans SA1 = DSM 21679]
MTLEELLNKTCLIGLSYFDLNGDALKQTQHAGKVIKVDAEMGITVQLHSTLTQETPEFILPPNLDAWYKAPAGHYKHAASGVDIENPDFLVTWDIHRTQETRSDGQHEWWEWAPNLQAPSVGS